MATVTQPPRPAEDSRYEEVVERQLAQARGRIRVLDLAAAVLGLLIAVLTFGIAVVLADRAFELSAATRQGALIAFGVLVCAYLYVALVRTLRRPINPYYAAKQVERTLPDAKNSIVNYLDLKREPLPPAIRAAIGSRAARDIRRADVQEAIRGREVLWLGAIAGVLLLAAVVLLVVLRPTQFFSLLNRAFAPFSDTAIATRTQLTLVQPEGGDTTVVIGEPVHVVVHVGGRVPDPDEPDALRLLYRHNPTDTEYQSVPLQEGNDSREWVVRVPARQVQTGFWYRVAGGDAQTPEYRVQVRSLPLFTGFEVAYDYPAYLRWEPQTTNRVGCQDPITAVQGTEVTLTAHTNRTVAGGVMQIDGRDAPVPGEKVPGQPKSLRFRFTLTGDATYRVWFTSDEDEQNRDPKPYAIRVITDTAPRVIWVSPEEEEIQLPANGLLPLEAFATDDFGIDSMALKMRIAGDQPLMLEEKPYRGGKSFRRESDNSYPTRLDYKDFVELAKLRTEEKAPANLREGMVLEYWLEAKDNRSVESGEFKLGPNVGRSAVRRVRIVPPEEQPEKKQEQEQRREKLQKEQQKHEQQQDQKHQDEPRDPNQPQQGEEAGQPQDQPRQGEKKEQGRQGEPKEPEGNQNGQGEPKAGPQQNRDPQGQPKDGDRSEQNADQQPEPKEKGSPDERAEPKAGENENPNDQGRPNPEQQPRQGGENRGQPKDRQGDPQADPNAGGQAPQAAPNAGQRQQRDPRENPQAGGNPGAGTEGGQGQDLQQQANRIQNEIDKLPPDKGQPKQDRQAKSDAERQDPGEAKGEGETQGQQDSQSAGQPKPAPAQAQEGGPDQQSRPTGADPRQPTTGEQKPAGEMTNRAEKSDNKDRGAQSGQQQGEPKNNPPVGGVEGGQDKPKPEQQPSQGGDERGPPMNREGDPQNRNDRGQDPKRPEGAPKGSRAGEKGEKGDAQQQQPGQPKGAGAPKPDADRGGKPEGASDPMNAQGRPQEQPGAGEDPNPAAQAGRAKPDKEPQRGDAKGAGGDAGQPGDRQQPGEQQPRVAQDKPRQSPDRGEPKPRPDPDAQAKGGQAGEPKKGPDQGQPGGQPSGQPKPEGRKDPMGGAGGREVAKGQEKPERQPQGESGGQGQGGLDLLKQLARDLNSDDARTRELAELTLKEMQRQGDEAMKELAKDLKSGDAQTREAAQKKLEQMRRQAEQNMKQLAKDLQSDDPQTRKEARQALDALNKQQGDEQARQEMKEALEQMAKGRQGGQQPMGGPSGEPMGDPMGQPMNPNTAQGNQPGGMNPQEPMEGMAGANPTGNPSGRESTQEAAATEGPQPVNPTPPDPEAVKRSMELQLEQFKRNADNEELLKRIGMTREEYQRFIEAYERELARRSEQPADAADLRPGARGGSSAANQGARRVEAGTPGAEGDLSRVGPLAPPREFRNPFKNFREASRNLNPPSRE